MTAADPCVYCDNTGEIHLGDLRAECGMCAAGELGKGVLPSWVGALTVGELVRLLNEFGLELSIAESES